MKVGDLVSLKNLHEEWGDIALITSIHITEAGTGQIYLIAGSLPNCTIPWLKRDMYIKEVVRESR